MGICSSSPIYSGKLDFQIQRAYYESGDYAGTISFIPNNASQAKYLIMNLIGIEAITSTSTKHQKEFLRSNLVQYKLEKPNTQHSIDFQKTIPNPWVAIKSNYCKIQNINLSTTIYIECYLSKSMDLDSQSSSILPNSRRLQLLKVNQSRLQVKNIVMQYNPAAPGFAPIVHFSTDRNIYVVGQQIRGTLKIDNTKSQSPLIKNQFLVIQVVELMSKNSNEIKTQSQQVMVSQLLDTLQCESRIMQIDVPINLAFKDAVSYYGQIYRINYYIQLDLTWDGKEPVVLRELIFVFDQ